MASLNEKAKNLQEIQICWIENEPQESNSLEANGNVNWLGFVFQELLGNIIDSFHI